MVQLAQNDFNILCSGNIQNATEYHNYEITNPGGVSQMPPNVAIITNITTIWYKNTSNFVNFGGFLGLGQFSPTI